MGGIEMGGIEMGNDRNLRQRGFTLLEMIIAAVMLMMLSHMVTTMIISGQASTKYAERLNRVTEITQELIDDMQRELRSAVRLFENDALGLAYRARLEAWAVAVPINTSTLPLIRPTETFRKDLAGTEKTGNEMIFARSAWSDAFTCTSGNTYRLDTYRIVWFYMKTEGAGPQPPVPTGLNFCKWVSEPVVDGAQVDAITNAADQAEVLVHLVTQTADAGGAFHPKIEVAWRMGEDPSVVGTFRHIQTDGSMDNTPQLPRPNPWRLLRDPTLGSSGMLAYRWHSLASNYSMSNQGVGRFGIVNSAIGNGFPHGLEVQIIGPSAARQVLIHITLVSNNAGGQRAYFDLQAISDVREG